MALETKKTLTYFLYRLVAIMGPVLITSYFTYRSATYETEVGYKATVDAVDKLQKVTVEQAAAISQLHGEVKVLQDMLSGHMNRASMRPPTLVEMPPAPPTKEEKVTAQVVEDVTKRLKPLPRNLEAAKEAF
jgi:hypothetical protein